MFLEYWQIGLFFGMWMVSTWTLCRKGYREGLLHGAEDAIYQLEELGLIYIDDKDVIHPIKK